MCEPSKSPGQVVMKFVYLEKQEVKVKQLSTILTQLYLLCGAKFTNPDHLTSPSSYIMQNAPYLASKKGHDMVNAVSSALINASYGKQTTQKVLIQSDDTSVLFMFRNNSNYKRVFKVEETISDASQSAVDEIKIYADVVVVAKISLIASSKSFLTGFTAVRDKMHAVNLSLS